LASLSAAQVPLAFVEKLTSHTDVALGEGTLGALRPEPLHAVWRALLRSPVTSTAEAKRAGSRGRLFLAVLRCEK
jgi:hypothetical protein